MKPNYKPYHLINNKELTYFQENFTEKLFAWNEEYACEDIRLSIHCASTIHNFSSMQLLTNEHMPIALVDQNYLSTLKESLFKDNSDCLNQTCNELFIRLLLQIFALASLQLNNNMTSYLEWIYPGSACLNAVFNNNQDQFNLYLHPNWVLAQLPKTSIPQKPLARLDDALTTQSIHLTTQLAPLHLSVQKLLNMQVGDVIKTDHPVNKPFHIYCQHQKIGEGIAGQVLQHKSIQLWRSS